MLSNMHLFYALDAESQGASIASIRVLHVTMLGRVTNARFLNAEKNSLDFHVYHQFGKSRFGDSFVTGKEEVLSFDANYILAPDGTLWKQQKPLTDEECLTIWEYDSIYRRRSNYVEDEERKIHQVLRAKYEPLQPMLPFLEQICNQYDAKVQVQKADEPDPKYRFARSPNETSADIGAGLELTAEEYAPYKISPHRPGFLDN